MYTINVNTIDQNLFRLFIIPKDGQKRTNKKIFVIDTSGSMSGEPISVVEKIVRKHLSKETKETMLIFFNETCKVISAMESTMDSSFFSAHGRTNFESATNSLVDILTEHVGEEFDIFFLTDGVQTMGNFNVSTETTRIKAVLGDSNLYVIAFTDDADVLFLQSISSITDNGVFLYAKDIKELSTVLDLTTYIDVKKAIVNNGTESIELKMILENNVYTCLFKMSFTEKFEVKIGGESFSVSPQPITDEEERIFLKYVYIISQLKEQMLNSTRKIAQLERSEVSKRLLRVIELLSTTFDIDVFKISKMKREQLIEDVSLIRETIASFIETLTKTSFQDSPHEFSQVLTLSSSSTPAIRSTKTKRQCLKMSYGTERANVLAQKYTKVLNKKRKKAKNIGNRTTFEKTMQDEYICPLSRENIQTEVRNGSCFGICLDVTRKNMKIVVSRSFASVDSVIDYITLNGPESSFRGIAAENINAIFPLYINEAHWKVAKIRYNELCSFIETGKCDQWTISQQIMIPFKVLLSVEKNIKTDFDKKLLSMILETCKHILEINLINGSKFNDYMIKKFEKFKNLKNQQEFESIDVYHRLAVFMDVLDERLVNAFFLEASRRLYPALTCLKDKWDLMRKLLNIDEWYFHSVENIRLAAIRSIDILFKNNTKRWTWGGETGNIELIKRIWRKFTDMEFPSDKKMFSVKLYSVLYATNFDLVSAIDSNIYIEPLSDPIKFVEHCAEITIDHFRTNEKETILSLFEKTTDLKVVAGLINMYAYYVGCPYLKLFSSIVLERCPLSLQKLQLLKSGEYEGVKISEGWAPRETYIHRLWLSYFDQMDGDEMELWNTLFPKHLLFGVKTKEWENEKNLKTLKTPLRTMLHSLSSPFSSLLFSSSSSSSSSVMNRKRKW